VCSWIPRQWRRKKRGVAGGYGWRQERNRPPVEETKIETPGEDKSTVEEVERMEEQHSCLGGKTRGYCLQQEVARVEEQR
jgi:hypothetical protein